MILLRHFYHRDIVAAHLFTDMAFSTFLFVARQRKGCLTLNKNDMFIRRSKFQEPKETSTQYIRDVIVWNLHIGLHDKIARSDVSVTRSYILYFSIRIIYLQVTYPVRKYLRLFNNFKLDANSIRDYTKCSLCEVLLDSYFRMFFVTK